ncbi:MAG: hypothetical protein WBZ48_13425 [Bacteroidota bacterium]
MKSTLLTNNRESFKGLRLELSPEERSKFPALPRVFAVNSKGEWINFSTFEDSPEVVDASGRVLSREETAVCLTDIAMDLPEFGALKSLLSRLS